MTQPNLHVAIIGGGMGGLCLAQGLKKDGVSVAVYERDATPDSRPQGYRIHIDPQGSEALHECLPEQLWSIFDATGGESSPGFTIVTEQLEELLRLGAGPEQTADPVRRHRSISRITLRRILLAGLEDSVHFGKKFLRYEETPAGSITACFEDGSSAAANVLVGADGVHSRLRTQYLPHARVAETGVVGLGGTIPLSDHVSSLGPAQLLRGPVMVLPPTSCSLFMAMWKRSPEAGLPLRELGIEQPLAGDENYLLIALGGRPEYFGVQNGRADSGSALKEAMRRTMSGWHPNLRELVELASEDEIFLNPLRTSSKPPPWTPTHITLLGDAIHSMTPYRGIGGNIALKDAALLRSKLTQVHQGAKTLLDAVGEYERSMREYAFAAVADSLQAMRQFTGPKKEPLFSIIKFGMRTANAVASRWRSGGIARGRKKTAA